MVTLVSGGGAVPTSSTLDFLGNASDIPNDFLAADGSAISRSIYNSLFSILGTSYGSGDGVSTFNIPNLNFANAPFGVSGQSSVRPTTGGTVYGSYVHVYTATTVPAEISGGSIALSGPALGGGSRVFRVELYLNGIVISATPWSAWANSVATPTFTVPIGSSVHVRIIENWIQSSSTMTWYGTYSGATATEKQPITIIRV